MLSSSHPRARSRSTSAAPRAAPAPAPLPYPRTAFAFDRYLLAYVLARHADFAAAGPETTAALAQFDRLYRACLSAPARRSRPERGVGRRLQALLLAARDLYPHLPAQTA